MTMIEKLTFVSWNFRDSKSCLVWPSVSMACPGWSAKSIRGADGGKEEGWIREG